MPNIRINLAATEVDTSDPSRVVLTLSLERAYTLSNMLSAQLQRIEQTRAVRELARAVLRVWSE